MPAKASQGLDLRHSPEARRDIPVMFRPEPNSVLHGRPSDSIGDRDRRIHQRTGVVTNSCEERW
jgi:hypothetical protein